MRAVTTESGQKLVLLGRRLSDQKKVVIKVASDPDGKKELAGERLRREKIHDIKFAYDVFFSPTEILFTHIGKYAISIQEFIEQDSTFLERPLKEQFNLALGAFKAQEGARATTYEHYKQIEKIFDHKDSGDYIQSFQEFKENILKDIPDKPSHAKLLQRAETFLRSHQETIEQYSGFLTHTDFVPHNIRISHGQIYLLDYSSIRFGNKHEGWARFLNFMTLYNPDLLRAFLEYMRNNRTREEVLSLRLMRIYRLGEIIWYYTRTLEKSSGNLHTLNAARINFWTKILKAILDDVPVSDITIEEYRRFRDSMRSEEEKRRQVGLH